MLVRLAVRDFVIVDTLDLAFAAGFTVLTGETGAGKSILIDALALTLGDRADADVVRVGCERAEIEAEFDIRAVRGLADWLAEQALDGDPDVLLLRRVVEKTGRSRAFVNGRSATLAQLREAGEQLVDIHGQHAHQSLLRADAQRGVLDQHANLSAASDAVANAYRDWQRLRRAGEEVATQAAARETERAGIAWQVEELRRLGLKPLEWGNLQAEHDRLAHAASLIEGADSALQALSEGEEAATAAVSAVVSRLRALEQFDATLAPTIESLNGALVQIEDAAHALRHYRDRVDLDPARLKQADERLEAIHSTARRLRMRPEELIERFDALSARLAELEIASDREALERDTAAARATYEGRATELSVARKKAATKLAREIAAVMKELALGVARFEIALTPIEGGSAHGNEQVEFLVATNAGVEPRPLAKVASGGELSRISLAIQVITSKAATVPTLIFDEVDAGIGGAVAAIVGQRLGALGTERQVFCVTHLAQVAAQADRQWSVAKAEARGKAVSRVTPLDDKARIEEIARMLGGTEITATTRRHAAEMLRQKR